MTNDSETLHDLTMQLRQVAEKLNHSKDRNERLFLLKQFRAILMQADELLEKDSAA